MSAELDIYSLKANQFFISEKKKIPAAPVVPEVKKYRQLSNIRISENLAQKIDNLPTTVTTGETLAFSGKEKSIKHEAKKTVTNIPSVKSCQPHIQDTFEDTWAIICLDPEHSPLSELDKHNFNKFSESAEIVRMNIYSVKPEETESALTKLFLTEGIDELITGVTAKPCETCANYVVLRNMPFK